jgi:ATP-dependent DNA helicase PIF1
LDVGHGCLTAADGTIELPSTFRLSENSLLALIDYIYSGIDQHLLPDGQYFSSHAIPSSCNSDVDEINQDILNHFSGEESTFHSTLLNNNPDSVQSELMYPVEYLNSINCSDLSLVKLKLKLDCPVMVLRNINAGEGACNGSRGIVSQVGQYVIRIQHITGDHAGSVIFVPQLKLSLSETQVPFEFEWHQFPLQLCFAMMINKTQEQ